MINEILHVGLYDLVLQDVQKQVGKEKPTKEELEKALEEEPQILRDYMQTNVEYNLSNIHLNNIDIETLDASAREKAERINQNLDVMREIEKYTLDFEHSSTLVLIFSVEFFVFFLYSILLSCSIWESGSGGSMHSFHSLSSLHGGMPRKRKKSMKSTVRGTKNFTKRLWH